MYIWVTNLIHLGPMGDELDPSGLCVTNLMHLSTFGVEFNTNWIDRWVTNLIHLGPMGDELYALWMMIFLHFGLWMKNLIHL